MVIDEAQDFADYWWTPLLLALKDQEADIRCRWCPSGSPTTPRDTRQIANAFHPLTPIKMRLVGEDGPDVRCVPVAPADA